LEELSIRDGGGEEAEIEGLEVDAFTECCEAVDCETGLGGDEDFEVWFEAAEEACCERFGRVVHEGGHVERMD